MNRTHGLSLSYQTVYGALFVCFLLSLYTEVPLFLTNSVFIPSFVTLLFIPSFVTLLVLVPVLAFMFRNSFYKYEAGFMLSVFSVLLISALISPGFDFVGQKLLGLLQIILSIVSGVLLVKLMDRMDRRIVARCLLILTVILVAGAVLEVIGVLRGASDAFRNVAYAKGGYEIYSSEARDLGITGFPRATFFTSEPSLLAKGFFVFVNSWLLISPSKRNYFAALFMTILLFILNGSPTLLLSVAISTVIVLRSTKRLVRLIPIAASLLVGFVVLVSASPVLSNTFLRFESVANISFNSSAGLVNDSVGSRLILPFVTLVDVWKHSPFFGVGISGKEVAATYSRFAIPSPTVMGNNAFAAVFIYLGLVGSLLLLLIFSIYLRRSNVSQLLFLSVLVVVLAVSMGALESPRFWGYVFLFIGVMKIRSSSVNKSERPKSQRSMTRRTVANRNVVQVPRKFGSQA